MSADTSASAAPLLAELSRTLHDAALDVVWRQWRALSAQTATRGHARSLVDPEALVLVSLKLRESEPRLRDVLADWVSLNASLLSVQRIKNLVTHHPRDIPERLPAFARFVLTEAKDARWRSLAANADSVDEVPRRTNKLRAREASFEEAAALWLRFRLGFSVSIKADTMAFLLGTAGRWTSTRSIASATNYTTPAVRRAVDDLSRAGVILARKRPETFVEYSVRGQPWADAFGLKEPIPTWRNWHRCFALVTSFLAWAENAKTRRMSRYAFGAMGRELLANHAVALEGDEAISFQTAGDKSDSAEAVALAIQRFAQWLVLEA